MPVLRVGYLLAAMFAVGPAFAADVPPATAPGATGPKDRVVFTEIAPLRSGVFISDADGRNERLLLQEVSLDYNASFSPDGQWIIFTSERVGSADIYRVHPDGSELERLVDSRAFDDQGALSPDGKALAFVSTREGGIANIWLLEIATGFTTRLTDHSGGNFRPSWSPDGNWIAFTSDRDQPHRRQDPIWELMHYTALYIMHPDGSGLKRLTRSDEVAKEPRWSSDGKHIVYRHSANQKEVLQTLSIDIESGAQKVLSADPISVEAASDEKRFPSPSPDAKGVVYNKYTDQLSMASPIVQVFSRSRRFDLFHTGSFATFSPDGRKMLVSGNLGNGNRAIWMMDSDGTHQRLLSEDKTAVLVSPSWSPDGKLIAFSKGGFFERPVTPGQLATVQADGSGLRTLTTGAASSGLPSFSPDGKRLVYRVFGKDEQGLRILSLDDGKITKLTGGWDSFPTWSPCGDRISFTRLSEGDFEIFTVGSDGSDLRQLTHDHGNDAHSSWSPDGKWVLFTSSRMGWKDDAMAGGQSYGELFVMCADGTGAEAQQLTDNQWEDGVGTWLTPDGKPASAKTCAAP